MHTRFEALWVPEVGFSCSTQPTDDQRFKGSPFPEMAERTFGKMLSINELSAEGEKEPKAKEAEAKEIAARIEAEVKRLDAVFNRFDAKSAVAALNRSRGKVKVESEDLWFLLEFCEQMRAGTQGFFDIAALSTFGRNSSTKGSAGKPAPAPFTLFHPSHEIKLSKGCVLDFGGIAKGYAVERVRKILCEEHGVQNAMLNFGGSSIAGVGHHPLGPCWLVAAEESLPVGREFELCDSALSVSGKNREGRYHIINPRTGRAPSREGNIAVQGRSALVCEALSTALYAAEPEVRNEIIANFEGYTYE